MAAILHNGLSGLSALKCRIPSDFQLLSIFCKVKATVNCRPITKFSTSIEDWRALTPITLLTGNLHPDSPVKEFNKGDMYRQNWHEVQPNVEIGNLVLLLESQTEDRRDYSKTIVCSTYLDK